jgi:hypothetical protein
MKLASLAAGMADALRRRGVSEPTASLTAEAGVAVFKVAFARWIDADDNNDLQNDLLHHIRESLDELKGLRATP